MKTSTITYDIAGTAYEGVFVYDETHAGRLPGVLLAPNWMGVTEGAIDSARKIAKAGFVVFVADMYGAGERPANPQEAAALAGPIKADTAEARRRAGAALATLKAEGSRLGVITDAHPAAVGFCFGGGNVLELCRAGVDLAAAVSIHGDLTAIEAAAPGSIKAPIMVLHGSADPIAPEAQRRAFEAEMVAAGARWSMMVFGGQVHSFTDPGAAVEGVAMYDETSCRWAFGMTEQFLTESFAAA